MPRPRLIVPREKWTLSLPVDLIARVSADLWSASEQRIPYGKLSAFVEECVREHYSRLDAHKESV